MMRLQILNMWIIASQLEIGWSKCAEKDFRNMPQTEKNNNRE